MQAQILFFYNRENPSYLTRAPRTGNKPSRAEPSFEHFELGLLIYERARAQAWLDLKKKEAWLELIRLVFHMNELDLNLELKPNPEPIQVCIVINPQAQSIYFLTFGNQFDNKYIN